MQIDMNELTNLIYGRSDSFPLLDRNVIIRTVPYDYTGHAEEVKDGSLVLSDAAWIVEIGGWSNALLTGELSKVEPYPGNAFVTLLSIVDFSAWDHPLPRETK